VSETNSYTEDWMIPWRCVSLALWEYRRGNWESAAAWSKRCLSYKPQNASRTGTAMVILAMSEERSGQDEEARSELAQASDLIENKFKNGLDFGNGSQGFWFDWVLARTLAREAAPLILGTPLPVSSTPGFN